METSQSIPDALPAIVRIGVIGHRTLRDVAAVANAARQIILKIKDDCTRISPRGGCRFVVLSSLAEGADRILARETLAILSGESGSIGSLCAMLPMSPDRYINDFAAEESRAEFAALLGSAQTMHVNPPAASREIAYTECAQHLVEGSDILVAVWDGQPSGGPGGTASSLAYARSLGRHIYTISSSDSYQVTEIEPTLEGKEYRTRIAEVERLNRIRNSSVRSKIEPDPVTADLSLWLGRTDNVARKAGILSRLASDAIQWLSVLAVLLVAAQTLFFPQMHRIVWIEVVFIAAVILLSVLASRVAWQRRWADYRFCAERLRAYQFLWRMPDDLALLVRPTDRLFTQRSSTDWVSLLLDWVWQTRLQVKTASRKLDTEFFLAHWIEDQIRYYRNRQIRLERLERTGTILGLALFGLTVLAAILHVLHQSPQMSDLVVFVAIAGPALAGGLAGVRSHRDHVRLAERYRQCADQLEQVARALGRTSDRDAAARLILNANNIMLAEHSDWRITAHTREVGPR